MVTIRKNLVPYNRATVITSGQGNKRTKICIHETDNAKTGANADAHGRLQYNGNKREASWHYQVDDKEVVQSFDHTWRCWAAGNTKGNDEAIHIEICVNSDSNYIKACENAARLVAKIMKDENITINNVVQHNYYSGKNCPRIMRGGGKLTWTAFINLVKEYSRGGLSVKDVENLQSQINTLDKQLKTLQSQLNNKATARSDEKVAGWAKTSYDWAVLHGLTDGTNPRGALTREQGLTMLKNLHDLIIKKVEKQNEELNQLKNLVKCLQKHIDK